jgi:phage terminase large subunit
MVAVAEQVINVEQTFYRQQIAFLGDTSRYPAFVGGRNSGKTFTGAYKALKKAAGGGLGLIAGPNFPAMKRGPKPAFLKLLAETGIPYIENKNDNMLVIPAFNAEIQFAGLENDTYTRGPNYRWGWIDELDYVTNPEMYKTAKAAVRAGDSYQLFSTSTPKGHYIIYQEWVLDADDFHRLYRATSYDNFFVNADDYVAGLNYSGNFYEQEIKAEFVTFEGLVYPGWDRLRQVQDVDCADWPCVLGLDSGLHVTALMTLRHSGDRYHIERELYRGNMSNDDIVDAVCAEYARSGASFLVFDPAAGNLGVDLQRSGLRVRKAQKGPGSVEDGIRRVNDLLPGLTVDPACRNFIAEIEAYQYPPGGEKDQPIKANDHLMDDLRYIAMELTQPKKQVRVYQL